MERLQRFLDKGLQELNAEDVLEAGRVFALWSEIVGPAIAAHAIPRNLRSGVLFVEVSSAAWANELHLLKPRIMQAISARIGCERLKDVRWQVAPSWRQEVETTRSLSPASEIPPLSELDSERRNAIEASVSEHVSDPDLARTVGDLMTVLEQRQESKRRLGYRPCRTCGVLVPPQSPDDCPVCRLGDL